LEKTQTKPKQSNKTPTQPTLTELDADDKYPVKANNVKQEELIYE